MRIGDTPPALGADGTVYARVEIAGTDRYRVVALDQAGRLKPGWPYESPAGGSLAMPVVGPDDSIYIGECRTAGCLVHRFDPTGRERPGWPFRIPPEFACPDGGHCIDRPVPIPDGGAVLPAYRSKRGQEVIAIDSSGLVTSGWPVVPGAAGLWSGDVTVAPDGTVFVLSVPDGSVLDATIEAYAPDGRLRAGWPVSVPERSRYVLGPDGTVIVWSLLDNEGELCDQPRRTLYTVLGPDGRTRPGWPRGSTGYASDPIVSSDGTVYYISARGNVYAHDGAGEVKAGWPVAMPDAAVGCVPTRIHVGPDQTLYIAVDVGTRAEIAALSPDGRSRRGWPYHPEGGLGGPCFDTECSGGAQAPVFGPDGRVYALVFSEASGRMVADAVALDAGGMLRPGWPVRMPFDPAAVQGGLLAVTADGRLLLQAGGMLFSFDPDGTVSS